MHLKNKEENISGYFQVFGIFGFFLFCLKGFYFCPKCALHVTMRFILHFSLFWQCKKGLRKEQRGHFIPFTIQWVQHFPKPPFPWDVCLAGGYTLPAWKSPWPLQKRTGNAVSKSNHSQNAVWRCPSPRLHQKTLSKSFYGVQPGFTSLELLEISSGKMCCPFQAIERNKSTVVLVLSLVVLKYPSTVVSLMPRINWAYGAKCVPSP